MLNFFNNLECNLVYKPRVYTYKPVAVHTVRPIELADLKAHAKIDFTDTGQDDYINFLIDAAVDVAERFTNRVFINQQWKTYRDFFSAFFILERGQNATIDSFKYKNTAGVLIDVDASLYYVAVNDPYSKIVLKEEFYTPADLLDEKNCIEITFTAGYGIAKANVPASLRAILLEHVTWLYENKGNCAVTDMPDMVRNAYYSHFKIVEIDGSTYL